MECEDLCCVDFDIDIGLSGTVDVPATYHQEQSVNQQEAAHTVHFSPPQDNAQTDEVHCKKKWKEALMAIDNFRLIPRPTTSHITQLKNKLMDLKDCSFYRNQETQEQHNSTTADGVSHNAALEDKWKKICSLVMDECHMKHNAYMEFLMQGLHGSLDENLETAGSSSMDDSNVNKLFADIRAHRHAIQSERAEDARNLRVLVQKLETAQAEVADLQVQNMTLLQQSVDMVVEIGNLKKRVLPHDKLTCVVVSCPVQSSSTTSDISSEQDEDFARFLRQKVHDFITAKK